MAQIPPDESKLIFRNPFDSSPSAVAQPLEGLRFSKALGKIAYQLRQTPLIA